MAFDFKKEHVALSVAGILASAAIAYLIYRAESKDNAQNTQASIDAQNAAAEANAQNQENLLSAIQSISVPAFSSTTTETSSGNIATASSNGGEDATDAALASLIASFQANDNSHTTTQQSPVAQIPALQPEQLVNISSGPGYSTTNYLPSTNPASTLLPARSGISSLVSTGS